MHPSSSKEQITAEALVLAELAKTYGALAPMKLSLEGGATVHVDGATADQSVIVEVFAHQGRMRGSQPKKVAQDALKLITLGRTRQPATLVLAFADEAAARSVLGGKGWLAEALATWGVIVETVDIGHEHRAELLAAQGRQRMVNPPPDPGSAD